MCFDDANVIMHNSSREFADSIKNLESTDKGFILLFDEKKRVTALVKEVAPEVKFNIKTKRRRNRLSEEDSRLFKNWYDVTSNVKN